MVCVKNAIKIILIYKKIRYDRKNYGHQGDFSMKTLRFFLLLITATLCGCVYHQPFEQGNILTTSKVQSIQPGMTSAEVIAKLGSPVLENMYKDNRMTYVYTSQPSRNQTIVKKLEIDFRNNHVTNIRTDL